MSSAIHLPTEVDEAEELFNKKIEALGADKKGSTGPPGDDQVGPVFVSSNTTLPFHLHNGQLKYNDTTLTTLTVLQVQAPKIEANQVTIVVNKRPTTISYGGQSIDTPITITTTTDGYYQVVFDITEEMEVQGIQPVEIDGTLVEVAGEVDTVPPTIQLKSGLPSSINQGQSLAISIDDVEAADDGDVAPTVTFVVNGTIYTSSFNTQTLGDGAYTITYVATDAAGNQAQVTRSLTVLAALTKPVIEIIDPQPRDTIEYWDGDIIKHEQYTTFTVPNATASDNRGNTPAVQVTSTVNENVAGEYTVTYTSTNSAGTSTHSFTVRVLDTIDPTVTLKEASTMTINLNDPFSEPGATVTDGNNPNPPAFTVAGTVDTSVEGNYTLTYTATDDAGNASSPVTRTVTVVDPAGPVVTTAQVPAANPKTVEVTFSKVTANPSVTITADGVGRTILGTPTSQDNLTWVFALESKIMHQQNVQVTFDETTKDVQNLAPHLEFPIDLQFPSAEADAFASFGDVEAIPVIPQKQAPIMVQVTEWQQTVDASMVVDFYEKYKSDESFEMTLQCAEMTTGPAGLAKVNEFTLVPYNPKYVPQRPDLGYRPFCGYTSGLPHNDTRTFTVTFAGITKTFDYIGKSGVGWYTFDSTIINFNNNQTQFSGASAGLTILLKSQFDPALASQDDGGGIAVIYLHGLTETRFSPVYRHTEGNTFKNATGSSFITYNQKANGPYGSDTMEHNWNDTSTLDVMESTRTKFQFTYFGFINVESIGVFWYNTFSYPHTTTGQIIIKDINVDPSDAPDSTYQLNQGTIYHEIGHTLGVGNAWQKVTNSYMDARGLSLTWNGLTWKGSLANQEYTSLWKQRAERLGLATTEEIKECPLEDAKFLGAGSANSHFSEHVFNNMQLTSINDVGEVRSKLLFDSMRDMGFNINTDKHETYQLSDYYIDSLTFADGNLTFALSQSLDDADVAYEDGKVYLQTGQEVLTTTWNVQTKTGLSVVLNNFDPPLDPEITYCFVHRYDTFGRKDGEAVLAGEFSREFTTPSAAAPTITGPAAFTVQENTTTIIPSPTFTADVGGVTWGLEGTDASSFSISQAGILSIVAAPDFESKTSFSLTITATANGSTGTKDITVTVTDVAAAITGPNTISIVEHSTGPVGTYTASEVQDTNHVWSVEGTDASDFIISNAGEVTFDSPPDWDEKQQYQFSVIYDQPLPNTTEVKAGNNQTFTLPAGTVSYNNTYALPRAFSNILYSQEIEVTTGATINVSGVVLNLEQLKINQVGPGAWDSDFTDDTAAPKTASLGRNDTGTIFFSHIFAAAGQQEVPLRATISVSSPLIGPNPFTIPLPYDGSNVLLNTVIGTDYSIIDAFLPTMTLEVVEPAAQLPVTVTITQLAFSVTEAKVLPDGDGITVETNQPIPLGGTVIFTPFLNINWDNSFSNNNEVTFALHDTVYVGDTIVGRLSIPNRTDIDFNITNESTQTRPIPTVIPDASGQNPIEVSADGTSIDIPFSGPAPTTAPVVSIATDESNTFEDAATVTVEGQTIRATLATKAYTENKYNIKINNNERPYTVRNTRTEKRPTVDTRIKEVGYYYANNIKYLEITVEDEYQIETPQNITGSGLDTIGTTGNILLKNDNRTVDIPFSDQNTDFLQLYSSVSNLKIQGEGVLEPFLVKGSDVGRMIGTLPNVVIPILSNMPPVPDVGAVINEKFTLTFPYQVTLAGNPFGNNVESATATGKTIEVVLTQPPTDTISVQYTESAGNSIMYKDYPSTSMPTQSFNVPIFQPLSNTRQVRVLRGTATRRLPR
jgi:hypothetical protein